MGGLPSLGQPPRLIEEHGPLIRPDPNRDLYLRCGHQCRTFGAGRGVIEPEIRVHGGVDKGPKIRHRGDRHHMADPACHRLGQHPRHRHPRHQMPARRMTHKYDRSVDLRRGGGHGVGDLSRDIGDPNLGAEVIRRHRHRPAARQGPSGEMRPEGPVKFEPIAAMHKDAEALRRSLRPEKIEPLAIRRPVGDAKLRAAFTLQPVAKRGGIGGPSVRIGGGLRNVGGVGVGVVPVHASNSAAVLDKPSARCFACARPISGETT